MFDKALHNAATGKVRMASCDTEVRWLRLTIWALVVGVCAGCAGGSPQQDASWKLVPITEVGMVVGEWVRGWWSTLPEGSVRLMIRANSTYLSLVKPRPERLLGPRSRNARRPIGRRQRSAPSHLRCTTIRVKPWCSPNRLSMKQESAIAANLPKCSEQGS